LTVRLTVIGCSGSFPGPDSPASCYLIEADGFRLLLDLGNGALGALQRHAGMHGGGVHGGGMYDIDAVCLSHLHADHCLDLCSYSVARTYPPGGARPRIPVYGPAGTQQRMDQAFGLHEPRGMAGAFDFVTLTPGTRQVGPLRMTLATMNHPVETFGFRIEHAGRVIAYSADTGPTEALAELARGADLLLCEASFLDGPGLPEDVHLTARQAGEYAAAGGVGHLVLTHLVPWNDREQSLREAASAYSGPLSLAASGWVIDLGRA
jgi:ribonuclease BN (tRNA processing enzyme)